MLNSDKTMYWLLFLALIVLVVGTNFADAAEISENNLTDYSNPTLNTDQSEFNHTYEGDIEKNIQKKKMSHVKKDTSLNDLSLSVDDIECDYGDTVDIDVVTDPEVDEGILTWYVDDKIVGARNISNSAASYTLRTGSYVPGIHEIMVTYSASLNYVSNQTTALLTINKQESEISNMVMNFNENNDIDVTLNVIGSDGEVLDFGTLNVYCNGENIESVEIEDYDVSFTLDKRYNMELVSFEYLGDEYYDDSIYDEFVYVEKMNTNIYLPYMTAYQSSIVNQSVTFYSDRKINDGRVNVYVEGNLIDTIAVDDEDVNVVIDTKNYVAGNYSVYIEYVDSDVYNDAHHQTTLRVNQIATTLYTNNLTAHKNDYINLRATVYNSIDETSEGLIEFFIDDESIKTMTVNNSTVNTVYLIPDNLEYGVHELKIIYYGSQKYRQSQTLANLNITKYFNSISLRNYTLNEEGNIVLNIREYSYQNTVDDGVLNVYVDGTLVSTENVIDNITTVTLPENYTADNTYTIHITYSDSVRFDDADVTEIISPEKHNTSIRLYTFINNENILNITSYVYSTNYAQINEGIIHFYINDTLISTVNVTNNSANLLYNMEDMEETSYVITAEYIGTKSYRNSENTTDINFNINRKTLYIQTDSQIRTLPADSISITARLTDYESNTLNITAPATIHILNETLTGNFVEGILNCEYTIDADTAENTYNITIEVNQTKYYKNATRNVRLIVQKNSPYITCPNVITSVKGETLLINATLNYNNEVVNENITGVVKINGKTVYQGKFFNGLLQYRLNLNDKYTNNNYIITIKSGPTAHYKQAERNMTLNLNARRTYITSKNIMSKNGEKIIINATVYDYATRKTVKGNSKV